MQSIKAPAGCGLTSYTEKEIENHSGSRRVEIAGYENHALDFINKAVKGENWGKKLLLGKIGAELSQRIFQQTQVNLLGYNLELRSNEIKHALKKHGNEKTETRRGQQAITTNDVSNFPYIIYSFDKLTVGRDKSLHFVKNINGQITIIANYANSNKSLSLKTMFRRKNKGGFSQAVSDQQTLNQNVQDDLGTAPYI